MKNKRKIINDPVFGFIQIPNAEVYEVLEHPYVQRLTRIKQLGVSHFVFPGATHTRFLHSIGAMHLMEEAIRNLRDKGIAISDSEATSAEIAILLHDVGHGPFSHVLENTLVSGITHEEISLLMMEQINRDVAQSGQMSLYGEIDRPLDEAIAIFKDEYPRHFLHQLISSQLDVDRMDYLCRDSHFCGVTEGTIPASRLLKMLHVAGDRLVVERKGIYSVEEFLVARRLMYWQVYLHKTSVSAEQVLIKILERAKHLAGQGVELFASPALHFFLYHNVSKEEFTLGSEAFGWYARLDDTDIQSAVKVWMLHPDKILSTLCKAFVNRHLFKAKLCEEGSLQDAKQFAEVRRIQEQLELTDDQLQYFYSFHNIQSKTYSQKDDSIDILYPDGSIRNIAEASDMWNLRTLTKKVKHPYLYYYDI